MKNFTQKTAQSFTATALVLACSGMSMIGSTAYGSPVLVNGGFENPLVGGSVVPLHTFGTQISQFHASDVPGWSTTDSENAIEIWQDGAAGVNAFEGNQFAEINATTTGTLSTMVTPSSGSMIGFEFAHRGRSSSIIADVALVEIYDLGFDGRFGTNDDIRLMSELFSATNVAWNFNERSLGFATGNTLLLQFGTFSTASIDPAGGNFLDGVRFGQNVPAPGSVALLALGGLTMTRRRRA